MITDRSTHKSREGDHICINGIRPSLVPSRLVFFLFPPLCSQNHHQSYKLWVGFHFKFYLCFCQCPITFKFFYEMASNNNLFGMLQAEDKLDGTNYLMWFYMTKHVLTWRNMNSFWIITCFYIIRRIAIIILKLCYYISFGCNSNSKYVYLWRGCVSSFARRANKRKLKHFDVGNTSTSCYT